MGNNFGFSIGFEPEALFCVLLLFELAVSHYVLMSTAMFRKKVSIIPACCCRSNVFLFVCLLYHICSRIQARVYIICVCNCSSIRIAFVCFLFYVAWRG